MHTIAPHHPETSACRQKPLPRARMATDRVLRGKWRLDALLGSGAMASVYAATHRNCRRGAVKILHRTFVAHEEARQRFLREGYAANTVGHPGAVQVFDDDITEDGLVFLVMELLQGDTLARRFEARGCTPFEVREVVDIADQLLDVLAAAHSKGVVHRDIKPENLFMTQKGALKVLDFGAARVKDLFPPKYQTLVGRPIGTPGFMAPEQALGNWASVDGRSDLWGVGATMFWLLTGHPAHAAETVEDRLLAAVTKPARRIRRVNAAIPGELAAIVDRALAFRPEDRWADARSMQEAIREFADDMTETALMVRETPAAGVVFPRPVAAQSARVNA